MRNAGTIPGVVLSAWPGRQRCWPAAVRPTPTVHLRWLAGENLWQGVLSRGSFRALARPEDVE